MALKFFDLKSQLPWLEQKIPIKYQLIHITQWRQLDLKKKILNKIWKKMFFCCTGKFKALKKHKFEAFNFPKKIKTLRTKKKVLFWKSSNRPRKEPQTSSQKFLRKKSQKQAKVFLIMLPQKIFCCFYCQSIEDIYL